ncbi:50S ribosomal protein L6 [Candidatus Omnitrophota bacterium]
MSKIGRRPIALPKEVKLEVKDGVVLAEGSRGKLSMQIPQGITVEKQEGMILVKREFDNKKSRSFHGLVRALVANMVEGVSKGFMKELEIKGVGYKSQVKGDTLVLQLGFSHPVEMAISSDLKVTCPAQTRIVVEGIDRQKVGEFAAKVRRIMPPEPYKGKGIRYKDEQLRKKLGKAMAKG